MGWIIAFWISAIVLFYVYVGYPVLIFFLSKLFPKSWNAFTQEELDSSDILPHISFFIPAYNEEQVIEKKIRNTLELDYPKDKIEIVVASDGSDDRTNEITELYSSQIRLIAYKVRGGKTSLINKTIPQLHGEIIVFSDASAMLEPQALQHLISPFKDTKIGSVSGLYILRDTSSTSRAEGEGFYWHYETSLKTYESRFYSILGAHGALYALRKSLFRKLPSNAINDDYILPMYGIEQKRRAVYQPTAVATEEIGTSVGGEMKRRIRISVGNFQQLFLLRKLLNPLRGRIAFEFHSHKLLRSFSFLFMIILFVSNIFIQTTGFQIFLLLQILFYIFASIGVLFFKNKKMPVFRNIPFYLAIINYAALIGLFKYIFNTQKVTWERPS